ncbi:hypothetical protein HL653_21910 [Sphingomonas sp. AP4-R1]|uniref:hypothetical protein n=1 Tax=Sphingomonas sp. AP4-R1 TaxID=2735134 RepID=UPI0014933360|nr:hypothetical protein [Sphingomonas sp. AP4-R1]QJU60039.1 hypothetical protein HL653_21910 [Sphingomonas sp. AP4-R1]
MSNPKRTAIAAIALAGCLLIPAARERPAFTGAYVASVGDGAGSRRGGWDFAPMPGVRLGVDAESAVAGDRGMTPALAVGGRVGAVVTPRTLVYVRAGYARIRRGRATRRHGWELAAGIERIAQSDSSARRDMRVAANAPDRTIVSETIYRL